MPAAGAALFLGTLEFVVEEGPRDDWFEDRAIAIGAAVCAVSAVLFFWPATMRGQFLILHDSWVWSYPLRSAAWRQVRERVDDVALHLIGEV